MAIRRIKINDFQSHKDTEIKLDEGVTIISGSSDIGKSCLMGIERERPMSEKWKANLQTMARLSLERPLFKGYIMDRFWGKEKDAIAAKQLGVEEDWSIFMMANEMDYIDDIRRVILNSEEEDDYMFSGSAEQIIEAVHAATRRVMLPGRLQLVGMSPLGDETKEVYGVVDFSGEYQPTEVELEEFRIEDWRYEVSNHDTKLGYLDWVEHRAESLDVNWEPS